MVDCKSVKLIGLLQSRIESNKDSDIAREKTRKDAKIKQNPKKNSFFRLFSRISRAKHLFF